MSLPPQTVMHIRPRCAAQLAAQLAASIRAVALPMAIIAALVAVRTVPARAQGGGATSSTALVSIRGVVLDSIHGSNLEGALVRVDSSTREGMTDANGAFRIDSVTPGVHRLVIVHPLLDTLGITLVSPFANFAAGDREVDLAVPSGETLVQIVCAPAWRNMGPAALVGFVRDADTEGAAPGAKVSLLWYQSDPLGLKKTPRVREATPDANGHYRICGLPADMSGKVQVFRGGVSSGEVPVEVKDGFLALRSLSVASAASVQVARGRPDSTGAAKTRVRGRASVSGRIVNKAGQPVGGARVDVQGIAAATITRPNGEFTLDSLPSGTQTLEVRKLGYAIAEQPVELSTSAPQQVTIRMSDFVPTLETVRVEATREKNLFDVGFEQRKKMGMGYYIDGDKLSKNSIRVTDALRTVPGIHIVSDASGQNVIQSSRDATGGCVNVFVDGSPWQQQFPGDLDSFLRPDELGAIESYSPSTVPAQFTVPGQASCQTLVIWTERRLNRKH